jgi:hypothetical protein
MGRLCTECVGFAFVESIQLIVVFAVLVGHKIPLGTVATLLLRRITSCLQQNVFHHETLIPRNEIETERFLFCYTHTTLNT